MTPNEIVSTGGEEMTSSDKTTVVGDTTKTTDVPLQEQVTSVAVSETATVTPETETIITPPETAKNDDDAKKKKKIKPRILKTQKHGIYTIDHVESANFIVEWYKGLRTSAPYMHKLFKTYYSLSPTRAVLLVMANICKALLPSLELWVSKGFLDHVQQAVTGKSIRPRKLFGLAVVGVCAKALEQGLEVLTDNVDEVMERRLTRILESQLIEAHLRMDADQLASRKVSNLLSNAKHFIRFQPTTLIVRWVNFLQYILTIASSTYTLSQLMSKSAAKLIFLNLIKLGINIYRLASYHSGTTHSRITNNDWRRLKLMKSFSYDYSLRRDIIVTGLSPWLISEVHQANEKLGDIITKHPWSRKASSNLSFVRQLLTNVMQSLEYIWLIREGIGQGMSLGTLHLMRTSTSEIISKLYSLSGNADSATYDWKNLIAYYRALELQPNIPLPENPVEYVSKTGGMKIEARNIRYKYESKKKEEVLRGISFVINPGEMIAVVGFNGAGKSTLAKLLMRLADVTDGELLVNDVNVKDYDPATLRRHIAVLFQDIGKYTGLTILENIGIGKVGEITHTEAIHQSAKDADVAEFIDQLPHQYDTYLGYSPISQDTKEYDMRGRWDESDTDSSDDEEKQKEAKKVQKNLSGGQWQKIALARAFMRGNEADLLVLDEPTANLDPEAEYKLFESIRRLRKGLTTVYISHRFNTVRAADRIMVLEKGELKEFGTHEELMTLKDGKYHRLYSLQAKGFQLDDKGGVSLDVDGVQVNVKEVVE